MICAAIIQEFLFVLNADFVIILLVHMLPLMAMKINMPIKSCQNVRLQNDSSTESKLRSTVLLHVLIRLFYCRIGYGGNKNRLWAVVGPQAIICHQCSR